MSGRGSGSSLCRVWMLTVCDHKDKPAGQRRAVSVLTSLYSGPLLLYLNNNHVWPGCYLSIKRAGAFVL